MDDTTRARRRYGCLHVFLITLGAVVATVVVCFFVFRAMLFPRAFRPVRLSAREETALQAKLERIETARPAPASAAPGALEPEAYSETAADRTIRLTERELNALLAKNTDLADKVAIDLSPGLISAKILIPVDADVPVIGGQTLRVETGVSYSDANGKPVLMFKGVTVMGVPLPNAWLGGVKNVDLLQQAGGDAGVWQALRDGVESLQIEEGGIVLRLKE